MVRTQIQITEEQDRQLREVVRREDISLAEAIRRCIDQALATQRPDRQELFRRALALSGTAQDREQATDLSTRHDAYLAAANEVRAAP